MFCVSAYLQFLETDIGPVISKAAKARILSLIGSAKKQGAQVPLDGSNCTVSGFENGNFVGATVITGVKPNMECYKVFELYKPLFLYLGGDIWPSLDHFGSRHNGRSD